MIDFSLTVVFSSRKIDSKYVEHIKSSCGVKNLQILAYENDNKFSLTELYNKGLEESINDIIVFCHDDLIFETPYWGKKLLKHFNRNPDYGIIGIAGTNTLVNGCWWQIREKMHGIVGHSNGLSKWINHYSKPQGNKIKPMVVLDGLFFAVDRNKIKHRFDLDFKGFHFYDLSFFIPNFLSGVKIGLITDILVTHLSIGRTNQSWLDNKKMLENKYKENFPITI